MAQSSSEATGCGPRPGTWCGGSCVQSPGGAGFWQIACCSHAAIGRASSGTADSASRSELGSRRIAGTPPIIAARSGFERAEAQLVAGRITSKPSSLAFAFDEAFKATKRFIFEHLTIMIDTHENCFTLIFNNFIFVTTKIILKTNFEIKVSDQTYFAIQC